MFRNMVTSLFKYERIRTTDTKAKALRVWADRLITLAKRGDLHARRQALAIVREKDIVYKLFDEAKDRFGTIAGGYTRIIKAGRRQGDAAPVSIVELVVMEKTDKKKAKKKAKVEAKKEAAVKTPEASPAETEGNGIAETDDAASEEPSDESEKLKSEGLAEEESEKKMEGEPDK